MGEKLLLMSCLASNGHVFLISITTSMSASMPQVSVGLGTGPAEIMHEGQPAVDRYLKFLSSGSSDYSIELLKKAGVDMTTQSLCAKPWSSLESHLLQMEALLS